MGVIDHCEDEKAGATLCSRSNGPATEEVMHGEMESDGEEARATLVQSETTTTTTDAADDDGGGGDEQGGEPRTETNADASLGDEHNEHADDVSALTGAATITSGAPSIGTGISSSSSGSSWLSRYFSGLRTEATPPGSRARVSTDLDRGPFPPPLPTSLEGQPGSDDREGGTGLQYDYDYSRLAPGAYAIRGMGGENIAIVSTSNTSSTIDGLQDNLDGRQESSLGAVHVSNTTSGSDVPRPSSDQSNDADASDSTLASVGFLAHSSSAASSTLSLPVEAVVTACVVDDVVVEASPLEASAISPAEASIQLADIERASVRLERERQSLAVDRKRLKAQRRRCGLGAGLVGALGLAIALSLALPALLRREELEQSTTATTNTTNSESDVASNAKEGGSETNKTWMLHSSHQGPTEDMAFGRVVSLQRNCTLLAVSSTRTPMYGDFAGSIRVYHISAPGEPWYQLGQTIYGSNTDEAWGKISTHGKRLIVGAKGSPGLDGQNIAGRIEVYGCGYSETEPKWEIMGEPIYGRWDQDKCGADVAVLGDDIIAFSCVRSSASHGRVEVHRFEGGKWTQLGSDILGIEEERDFGKSIALGRTEEGFVLAIGSPRTDKGGTLQVFAYDEVLSEWVRKGEPIYGSSQNDGFGWSVAMSEDGKVIAGGAINNNDIALDGGHVRCFFQEEGNEEWSQLGPTISGQEGASRMTFVSLSGDGKRVAVSGRTGLAKVYDLSSDGLRWIQIGETIKSDHEYAPHFWTPELSGDGSCLAIGAPHFADGRGEAVIYDLPTLIEA